MTHTLGVLVLLGVGLLLVKYGQTLVSNIYHAIQGDEREARDHAARHGDDTGTSKPYDWYLHQKIQPHVTGTYYPKEEHGTPEAYLKRVLEAQQRKH